MSQEELKHYGTKMHSGRYPWGSGEDPKGQDNFLGRYEKLKGKGLSEVNIANELGMNTTQLRNNITWAKKAQREALQEQVGVMKNAGFSDKMISEKLGISEKTVFNYRNPKEKVAKMQLDNVTKAIEDGVNKTGYLDVGVGVERQLGVARNKFNAVVNKLVEDEGYQIHEVFVKRLSDPTKYTTVKVLTKETDLEVVKKNSNKIRPLDSWSDDNGVTVHTIKAPQMMDMNRIKIRYAEDGGADKDGLIELRPNTKDLDLGSSNYAQVRIGAGDNLYLKGMAAYSKEKFPDGVDVIFNTNKGSDVSKADVLKKMKNDPDNPFGTTIVRQKGALNIVNEQGDWDTWSTKMSSQFLSKQPVSLIKERLDSTRDSLKSEYDEINSLTNPVVKQHLMKSYVDGLDVKASSLKAQGLPRTKSHVLLPITDLKPNEIYAPRYQNGERVVLVRHPHGGIFEIPELVVNNRSSEIAKNMIGPNAPDAVGIHPSVASKLSGADFDGDTALVIPNNQGKVKTSRSLKELANFDPQQYKVPYKTIKEQTKQTQMGMVSNLITDMTIKNASQSEIARAVKHSMVVIDSEKHNLDYKQSAKDNGISALMKKYQTNINPDTGKETRSASTIVSRSKHKIDISQDTTARELAQDKVGKDGTVLKKGLTSQEIAVQLGVSETTVKGYLKGESFNAEKYSSGSASEKPYVEYVQSVQKIKDEAVKSLDSIKIPAYNKDAAKAYAPEVQSLNVKLNTALLNAPRERQAQILASNLFYANKQPDMTKDDLKKLRARSLTRARTTVGAERTEIKITDKEWDAIQSNAISTTKLNQILNNADMDTVRKLATPKPAGMNDADSSKAKSLLAKGYTYAEVAESLGVSTSTLSESIR